MTEPSRVSNLADEHPSTSKDDISLPRRLDFLQLTEADAERLRRLIPLFHDSAKSFIDDFYDWLMSFEETAQFLHDPELVRRLKEMQERHLMTVLGANWDDRFVEERRRVGWAHATRGVDPLLFLSAYYQFVDHMTGMMAERGAQDAAAGRDELSSIFKAVFLDVGLTLESYFSKLSGDLKQVLDMVWKANDELQQFTRLASHDLKTPLGTVSNLCEEVLDEFRDEIPTQAAELIETARQKIFQMSETIDDLLSVSLPAGNDALDELVSGETVVDDALERLKPELEKKQIEVSVSRPLPTVIGNKVQLREAIYNLLSNAEKYIDKQPGRIGIAAEVRTSECVFSFSDNGPGIPVAEIDQIFTAFRRLPIHADRPGSGLGLYFAKSLIEHQGGRIWAESVPGSGSVFYVALKRSSSD